MRARTTKEWENWNISLPIQNASSFKFFPQLSNPCLFNYLVHQQSYDVLAHCSPLFAWFQQVKSGKPIVWGLRGARPTRTDDRTWSLTAIDWSGLQSSLMAGGRALILPMINTYGIAVTNGLCAVMIWISFGYVRSLLLFMPSWFRCYVRIRCCITRYGDWMKAYCDVGFSTAENDWLITNEREKMLVGVINSAVEWRTRRILLRLADLFGPPVKSIQIRGNDCLPAAVRSV